MSNKERQARKRLREKARRMGIPEAGPPKLPTPPPPRARPRLVIPPPQYGAAEMSAPVGGDFPENDASALAEPPRSRPLLPPISRKDAAQEMRDALRYEALNPGETTMFVVAAAKAWLAQYNIDYAVEREERKSPQAGPQAVPAWFQKSGS